MKIETSEQAASYVADMLIIGFYGGVIWYDFKTYNVPMACFFAGLLTKKVIDKIV